MDTLFRLTEEGISPAPGTAVIKASEYAAYTEASALLESARARAAEIGRLADEAYEERRKEGYADGLEAGRLELAEKMMDTVLSSVEFIENIENTVVSVVNQSVRKIVGDLGDHDRIVLIVKNALSNVRGRQQVTVRVAPCDEPHVSEALAAMTAGSYLTIIADPRLEKDSCILESDLGVVDASLSTQLKALENAFTKKIGR